MDPAAIFGNSVGTTISRSPLGKSSIVYEYGKTLPGPDAANAAMEQPARNSHFAITISLYGMEHPCCVGFFPSYCNCVKTLCGIRTTVPCRWSAGNDTSTASNFFQSRVLTAP